MSDRREHPIGPMVRLLLPFAFGYFLSYIMRSVNAALSTELQQDLGLDANALGFLTSVFFLSFALMQIPLGVLLDRYGPRRVEAVLLLIAGLGALLFAIGQDFTTVAIGRLLIGLGMSACLMAAFTTINHWFTQAQVPAKNALIMAAGGLGAIFAADPVIWISNAFGWRTVFYLLTAACVLGSVLLFTIVPHRQSPAAGESVSTAIQGLQTIFSSRYFWTVTTLTMLSQASFSAVIGLWSGPWLRDVAGYDQQHIAEMLRWIAIAMTAGFLSIGNIAAWLSRKGVPFWLIVLSAMSGFLIVQPLLLLPYGWWSVLAWLGFGFFGTSGILAYPLLTRHFEHRLAGRVNASLNLLVFVCAFALQWGIGAIIKGYAEITSGIYPASAYRSAFFVVIIIQLCTFIYFWYHRAVIRDDHTNNTIT